MPQWTPDPTFYPSPKMAMEAPPERLAYLAMLDPTRQRPDAMAVVDQYGRVHGLQGLRVVDASVMPDVVRANTNATTIMIVERIADWIKAGR